MYEYKLTPNRRTIWSWNRRLNKYEFTSEFPDIARTSPTSYEHIFIYETSGNSQYIVSDEYDAWIVDWNVKTWFDLNTDQASTHEVFKINDTAWEIRVQSRSNTLTFESIGELNCGQTNQTITISEEADSAIEFTFDNLQQAFFYIFVMILWLFFVYVTFVVKGDSGSTVQLFNIMQLFAGFFLAFILVPISSLLALPVFLIACAITMGKLYGR